MQGTRKWRIEENLRGTAAVGPDKPMARTGGAEVSQLRDDLLFFTLGSYRLLMGRKASVREFGSSDVLVNLGVIPDH